MIAIGILTYNRPKVFAQCIDGVWDNLSHLVDKVFVYNDGSDSAHSFEYSNIYRKYPKVALLRSVENRGAAVGKNALLRSMLEYGADWIFLIEDDIEPITSEAVSGYINACEESGWQHLSFAHHGNADRTVIEVDGSVTYYRNYIGAYNIYSRESLLVCGLMDERFYNSFEHVEHSLRLAREGFTDPRPYYVADATGSENWLREIEGVGSTQTQEVFDRGRETLRQLHPRAYEELWPDE